MQQSQIPPKFGLAWGANAGAAYIRSIPQSSQIGIQNCAASLNDGFVPLTFTPSSAGGCPPFGQDFNGILKQITQWIQWQAVSSGLPWDSTFSANIGGYPKGGIVQSNVLFGRMWISTADNNTSNPDSTAGTTTNWIVLPGTAQPGAIVAYSGTVLPAATVSANGLTVGNASSNATNRANADTFWLFSYLWNNCIICTLYNSSGGIISKGASAAADFAANDAISVVNTNGTGLIGADDQNGTSSTNLGGVPLIAGNRATPTSRVGENLHTLLLTETPPGITSSGSNSISVSGSSGISVTSSLADIVQEGSGFTNLGTGGGGFTFTAFPLNSPSVSAITSTGSLTLTSTGTPTINVTSNNTTGGSHNNVELSVLVYWAMSL